jgi:hypothetical protein
LSRNVLVAIRLQRDLDLSYQSQLPGRARQIEGLLCGVNGIGVLTGGGIGGSQRIEMSGHTIAGKLARPVCQSHGPNRVARRSFGEVGLSRNLPRVY